MTEDRIWELLETVKDPEIPVVSIVELGIVREVDLKGDGVTVTITPTFIGCPAIHVMTSEVVDRLTAVGFDSVDVRTRMNPPWSSDWISEAGRQKLREFGIAPPAHHGGAVNVVLEAPVPCPYCGSEHTVQKNPFGPTACKAIFYCENCQQPFEQFKPM